MKPVLREKPFQACTAFGFKILEVKVECAMDSSRRDYEDAFPGLLTFMRGQPEALHRGRKRPGRPLWELSMPYFVCIAVDAR